MNLLSVPEPYVYYVKTNITGFYMKQERTENATAGQMTALHRGRGNSSSVQKRN
jgi:hypothetical protein